MTDNIEPGHEPETAAADLSAILADDQSSPAPQQEQTAEAPKAEEPKTDPEVKPEAKPAAEQPFWYRKQIEKERKERQRLERELEQARQAQPQPQLPDPRQDPMSYYETMRVMDRLERSEDRFIDKHGEQELEAVKDWLATRPDIEAWAIQQRHPWGAAFQQYQREKLSAEIGDDPNAWREKERARLREELAAEFAASAPPMAQRPNIPAPASGQRSAAPRNGPGFAGPTPLNSIIGG